MVGISAMTSFVNRGYEIADAVVVGESKLLMDKILVDLSHNRLIGSDKAETLPSMIGMPNPRQGLLKSSISNSVLFCSTTPTFSAHQSGPWRSRKL